MSTLSGSVLSGSTDGEPLALSVSGTPTTIHTVGSGTTGFDEVWLWVSNIDSVAHTLTVVWGSGNICTAVSIPANNGPTLIVPGIRLRNGAVISGYADTANKLNVTGHYNRVA